MTNTNNVIEVPYTYVLLPVETATLIVLHAPPDYAAA